MLPYTTFEDILSLVAVPCDEALAVTNPDALKPIMEAELVVSIPNHVAINSMPNGNTVLRAWANCFGVWTLLSVAPHLITVSSTMQGDTMVRSTPPIKTILSTMKEQAKIYAAAATKIYEDNHVPTIVSVTYPLFGAASPSYDPISGRNVNS